MHDHEIVLPAAGHQDHDAKHQDYCNSLPHRHVQVRAFSNKWSVHDQDILLPAAGHQDDGVQYPDHCNFPLNRHVQVRAFSDEW